MKVFADFENGRDNNFNLIRLLAAAAVLVSHAWPLSLGEGTVEPLEDLTGHSLGGLAVFVFFAISGFLITMSFDRSRSRLAFVAARVLRLLPGLVVSLVLVGFVLGPIATTLPVTQYLTHPGTWTALLRNITLVSPQYTLPGVFETNPYVAVQGSIWTLIHEVACYAAVFGAGILGLLRRRGLMAIVLLIYLLCWFVPDLGFVHLPPRLDSFRKLSLPFAYGMAFYVWRDRLPLSLIAVGGLAAATVLAHGTRVYDPLLVLTLAYATFWLAYVPAGPVRAYNRIGDFSYGTYIYAFPLQGLVVWLFGGGPWLNILLALPLTLVFAVASWHLVEKPALALRHRLGPVTRSAPAVR